MQITNSFLCQPFWRLGNPIDDCISDNINTPIADGLERNLGIAGSVVAAIICAVTKIISFILSAFIIMAKILIVIPILKIFKLFNNDDVFILNQECKEQFDILKTSLNDLPALQQLVEQVKSGEEEAPFSNLKAFWDKAGPKEKTVFVDVFSTDNHPSYKEVRNNLAKDIFYRPAHDRNHGQFFKWLSRDELPSIDIAEDVSDNLVEPGNPDLGKTAAKVNIATRKLLAECQFFHGTGKFDMRPLQSVESILKSKQLNINSGAYGDGVYCASPLPAIAYGPYFFGFNQKIQYTSRQLIEPDKRSQTNPTFLIDYANHTQFNNDEINTFWLAFKRPIPITPNTLSCILVDIRNENLNIPPDKVDSYCKEMSTKCKEWAGFHIPVVPLNKLVRNELAYQCHSKMMFPKEWQM